ncbi:hypothetical protein [Sphaerobacter sp.]|uniref:hypothetical protein n=1 Tax=Sphaerobacter sp. TaxID=2099654 RepID=UPI001E089105|nr:hypothetical protein [Sphaerobacter sp.]MBX5443719.1 hypothetical protein [Sphaerobacter sp.]
MRETPASVGESSPSATSPAVGPHPSSRLHRLGPALVLAVLAPVVAELLFGATPITNPGAFLPDLAVYGGGALLIREVVRRRSLGWASIIVLGVVFGIVEEGLALESLFNPDLFNAGALGGRVLGVNWVWTQWTLGYHAIWSISIPILLAELLFPARRGRSWLGTTGLIVAAAAYVCGVAVLAAIFRFVVAADFAASPIALAIASLVAALLVLLALRWQWSPVDTARPQPARDVPSPVRVGLLAFVAAAAWFLPLVDLPQRLRAGGWVLVPMIVALVVAAIAARLIARWAITGKAWSDVHRLALAIGALLVSMLYGFFYVTSGNAVDQAGQAVASIVALTLLALFARTLSQRGVAESHPTHEP